jgi:DNA-binding NtrC family response regulator
MKVPLVTLPPETMDILMQYQWPGNVRELENLLKRALLLSKSNIITPDLVQKEMSSPKIPEETGHTGTFSPWIPENLQDFEGRLFKHVIDQVEKELIEKALSQMNGNQVKTAKLLGISRAMLHERMEKFGL